MPFNLHYYFLHSIATAGRLQSLIETFEIFKYITDQNLPCALSVASFHSVKPLWLRFCFSLELELSCCPSLSTMDAEEILTWFIVSCNSETSPFQEGVTRHTTVVCPEMHCLSAWTLPCPCACVNLSLLRAGALLVALYGRSKISCKMIQKAVFFLKYGPGNDHGWRKQCWMGKGTGTKPVHKPS